MSQIKPTCGLRWGQHGKTGNKVGMIDTFVAKKLYAKARKEVKSKQVSRPWDYVFLVRTFIEDGTRSIGYQKMENHEKREEYNDV